MDRLRTGSMSARSPARGAAAKPGERASTFDMRMTSTLDASEGGTHISLVEYTRVQPPAHYQAPLRCTPSQDRPVHQTLFDRIKASSKSAVPATTLSKKADYRILASSTRRAGDPLKAAVSHYNLGVVADNALRHKQACACYKKFIAAVRAVAPEGTVPVAMSARRRNAEAAVLSSRTSRSVGAPPELRGSPLASTRASAAPAPAVARRAAEALGFNALAISTAAAGDLEGALVFHAEHAKVAPDAQGRVIALVNAGVVHRRLGNLGDSDACFQAALKLALAEGDDAGEMLAAGHYGLNAVVAAPQPPAAAAGSSAPAQPAAGASPSPSPPSSAPPGRRGRRFVRGAAAEAQAGHGDVAPSSPAAAAAAAAAPAPAPRLRCMGMAALDLDRAKDALTTLLQLHAAGDDPRNVARGHSALGTIAFGRGLLTDAAAHFAEASRRAGEARDGRQARLDRCQLGMAVAGQQLEAYMAAVGAAAEASRAAPSTDPAVPAAVPQG